MIYATDVAHRIGCCRAWHAEDPDARAVPFALALNSAAIDRWPSHKSAQYLDEAATLLMAHATRAGVTLETARAVAGVLGNRCQLRIPHSMDPAGDLEDALAAGRAAVTFLHDAIHAHAQSQAPSHAARDDLNGLLSVALAYLARAIAEAGQAADAESRLAEADALVTALGQRGTATASDAREVHEVVEDAKRFVSGAEPVYEYSLWFGAARHAVALFPVR